MLSWTNDRRKTFALAAIFSNHLRAVRRLNTTKSNSQSDKARRDGNTSAVPNTCSNRSWKLCWLTPMVVRYLRRVCKLNSSRFWLRLRLLLTSMESMEGEVVNSEGYVSWSSVWVFESLSVWVDLSVWELWPNFVRAKLRRKGFCASPDYSRINRPIHIEAKKCCYLV